ncbi:MAG: cellulose biosynthesis protein BcsG, partial [Plesiomonas shigelloides]
PMHVTQPSSYLAISQLVADLANGQAFSQDNVDVRALVQALPQTVPVVAANEGSVMLRYQGKEYLTLDRKTWTLYPQQPSR